MYMDAISWPCCPCKVVFFFRALAVHGGVRFLPFKEGHCSLDASLYICSAAESMVCLATSGACSRTRRATYRFKPCWHNWLPQMLPHIYIYITCAEGLCFTGGDTYAFGRFTLLMHKKMKKRRRTLSSLLAISDIVH